MANPHTASSRTLLALSAAKDLDALISAAFDALRAEVACDFASAFYRRAGSGLLRERDSRGREYGPDFMRRYVELTPAIPLALANPGIKVLPTRICLPRSTAALKRTAFYREIMRPQGWRHAVALCFWGDPPADFPVFVASVYRRAGRRDFEKRDTARLEHLYPFLDCAVDRVLDREASITVRDVMIGGPDGTRGLAILDGALLLVHANPVARQLCAAWENGGAPTVARGAAGAWRLPVVVLEGCRRLLDEWRGRLRSNAGAPELRLARRVPHPCVAGLAASIEMFCPTTASLGEPTFVLEFHSTILEESDPDRSASLLRKLTPAERAVAMVLADGLSNQEIADRLGKTVNAVKFLLHRVYEKTGIPSRAALVAVLRTRTETAPLSAAESS